MTTPAKQPDEFDAIRTVVETLETFSPDEQQRMLRWVYERLGLSAPGPSPTARASVVGPTPAPSMSTPSSAVTDIKSFIESKSPKSDNQFAAAVAYFYKFEAPVDSRKDAINKDDIVDACRMVQRKRPKQPAQVLVDALHQGLLDRADRGQYKINSVGENLVAMVLPSQEGAGAKRPIKKKIRATKKAKRAGN